MNILDSLLHLLLTYCDSKIFERAFLYIYYSYTRSMVSSQYCKTFTEIF